MGKIVLISMLLSCGFIYGQKEAEKKETMWFDELTESYYDGDYMTAYLGFGRFVEEYPKSDLAPRAVFNQAWLLRELGKEEEAKVIFEQIMKSDYDEQEAYGGIMEQYTLYKNRSAKHLAEIYLGEENYKEAAKYIYIFDKVYPYKHFCGNELSANEIYTDAMYAKAYHGKGNTEKAIKKLLPHMFDNGLAGNGEIVELLNNYLPQVYSKEELTQLMETSLKEFKIGKHEEGLLKLLGVRIPVYTYQLYGFGNQNYDIDLNADIETLFNEVFRTHPVISQYLID